ncbi:GNAT family N-acetyltransferase [Actinoplanes sp. NPDC023801]|uniref:GNAT family N-acetyltransferase n=1 Tax=Actinoplanes sp. NPDC023801 TaxID=3154595 RepID=UPI0033DE5DB1
MRIDIREKTATDADACLALLMRVHSNDRYPLHLRPDEVPGFYRSAAKGGYEAAAWVAERDGEIVGHVALHCPPEDPTLTAAAEATGLPADRLVLLSRLFVAPTLRRSGLGRALVRHATAQAPALGRRAVLDVGRTLDSAVALYESEGWSRVGELHLPLNYLDPPAVLDLWVYVSPASPVQGTGEAPGAGD